MDAKGDEKQAKIIAAAKEEFLKKGFQEANLRDIGVAAGGMSLGNIYRFYNGKDTLYKALVEPATQVFESGFGEGAFAGEASFPESLQAGLGRMAEAVAANADSVRLLANAQGSPYQSFLQDLAAKNAKAAQAQAGAALDEAELVILFGMLFHALTEVATRKLPPAKAKAFGEKLGAFAAAGWGSLAN